MRRFAIPALLLLAACASAPPPRAFVHAAYDIRRPTMVSLEVDGPEEFAEDIRQGLIDRDYSVLAPGVPTTGSARASLKGTAPNLTGTLTIFAISGTRVFEAKAIGSDPDEVADSLLYWLPRK